MNIKTTIPPFILILVSLLTGLTIGFGIFFYLILKQPQVFQMNKQQPGSSTKDLSTQIIALEAEVLRLKALTSEEPSSNATADDSTHLLRKPLVIFKPANSFSSSEKEVLVERLINPYFDFNNEEEMNFLVMVVSKNTPPVSGYYYTINTQTASGATAEFLYSASNTNQDWWLPECSQACSFTDSFKAKYPNIVSQY